jgi:uncharacterized membrane protein YqgA involved in biofilm formation
MGGAILNMVTVALGSLIGLLLGSRLPTKIQESVIIGLGLVTLFVGVSNASKTGNVVIPLLSIVLGVIVGELLDIQTRLEQFGGWLQSRAGVSRAESSSVGTMDARTRFITGFMTASLVFCIGPLTFVGSIQDGMGLAIGFQQLVIKSVLDMFASMAFAASFGVGVLFSIISILLIQGGLSLLGMVLGDFMSTPMINEMTGTGGLLLLGLSLILLDVKKPRMANFLPALVLAPLLVSLAGALGINIYPL